MKIDVLQLLFNVSIWAGFGIIHTILTFDKIKKIRTMNQKNYRLIYNIIAAVTLFLVLFYTPSITPYMIALMTFNFANAIYQIPLILGIIILLVGLKNWPLLSFLGFKEDDSKLNTTGIYAFSRHPVYTGIILILTVLVFYSFNTTTLSWLLGMGGYFIIGTIPEEIKLKRFFNDYNEYQLNVGRLFPYKFVHFNYIKYNLF